MISTEPCEVCHPPVQMNEMLSASWLNDCTEPWEVCHPPVQMDEMLSASGCMVSYIELCEMQLPPVQKFPWWGDSLTWPIRGLATGQSKSLGLSGLKRVYNFRRDCHNRMNLS